MTSGKSCKVKLSLRCIDALIFGGRSTVTFIRDIHVTLYDPVISISARSVSGCAGFLRLTFISNLLCTLFLKANFAKDPQSSVKFRISSIKSKASVRKPTIGYHLIT